MYKINEMNKMIEMKYKRWPNEWEMKGTEFLTKRR